MRTDLFETVVVPVADPDDARETARAIEVYLDDGAEIIVTHVVPKGEGAPDEASVEQREGFAEEAYQVFYDELPDAVSVTPLTLYGRDVGATIVEGALDADATVIAYTPRGMSRWMKLLTGSVSSDIIENGELPVLVLPDEE
jgi:nucleotide-binding universal stress UspA family protein